MKMTWTPFMGMQKKMHKELEKINKRRAEIMSDERETRERCDTCDRIIMWNAENRCEECRIREISDN